MVSFGRLDLCLRMYRSNSSSIALRTGAIDGNANNWLLVSGALLDRIGRMMRPRENLPRSSSRKAKGSVIAVPRSSAAALCALRTGRMLASRMKTVTKNRNTLAPCHDERHASETPIRGLLRAASSSRENSRKADRLSRGNPDQASPSFHVAVKRSAARVRSTFAESDPSLVFLVGHDLFRNR